MPLRRVLETFQHDFPVDDDGRVVGMLGREAMLRALADDPDQSGSQTPSQ